MTVVYKCKICFTAVTYSWEKCLVTSATHNCKTTVNYVCKMSGYNHELLVQNILSQHNLWM